jgi:hypothetical protein
MLVFRSEISEEEIHYPMKIMHGVHQITQLCSRDEFAYTLSGTFCLNSRVVAGTRIGGEAC